MPGSLRKMPVWIPIIILLVAMASIQGGASLAKSLFPLVGAPGVTALRLALGTLILIAFSPVVSGKPVDPLTGLRPSLFTSPSVDFHWFPLNNPGLVSIPAAFFLGWLGTKLSKEKPDEAKWAELEVRSLTGIGAEKAVQH